MSSVYYRFKVDRSEERAGFINSSDFGEFDGLEEELSVGVSSQWVLVLLR